MLSRLKGIKHCCCCNAVTEYCALTTQASGGRPCCTVAMPKFCTCHVCLLLTLKTADVSRDTHTHTHTHTQLCLEFYAFCLVLLLRCVVMCEGFCLCNMTFVQMFEPQMCMSGQETMLAISVCRCMSCLQHVPSALLLHMAMTLYNSQHALVSNVKQSEGVKYLLLSLAHTTSVSVSIHRQSLIG